jgi:hypothetical protein
MAGEKKKLVQEFDRFTCAEGGRSRQVEKETLQASASPAHILLLLYPRHV